MNNRYDAPPAQSYRPEKPNHVRTGGRALFFTVIYHAVTWLLYTIIMTPLENQMVGDEHEPQYRFVMFGFSLLTLAILSVVMTAFYFKNGNRRRAYLAATSAEIRGAENVAEGMSRYRRLALTEAVISTAVTAVLWLIPVCFYTAAMSLSSQGYGYAEAWGIETFFVGAVGLFQPFQNAWAGWLFGLAILFCVHYFGRLYSHKNWESNRIRR
ncbi:MAG: hypothetical protein IJA91_02370 [Clostridia bacterium]|nr:hypothetical protein [Clostridia bacterium]